MASELLAWGGDAHKPDAKGEPKPDATHGASLLNTTLGDLLVAGLVEDPEDAGRIIAAAITQAGVSITPAKAPEVHAEPQPEAKAAREAKAKHHPDTAAKPKPDAEAKPEAKAKTPSDSTP